MKITKSYLQQIIKEELSIFTEAEGADYSDDPYMAPEKPSSEAFSSLEKGKVYKIEGISKETGKKKAFDNILFSFKAHSGVRASASTFYFKQGEKEFSGTEKQLYVKLGMTPGSIKFIPKESSVATEAYRKSKEPEYLRKAREREDREREKAAGMRSGHEGEEKVYNIGGRGMGPRKYREL